MNMQKSTKEVAHRLALALAERAKVTTPKAEENPFADKDVSDLLFGAGILSSADQHPALDMTPKGGWRMEQTRKAGLTAGKADKSAKRMRANRSRAERKAQFDALAQSPVMPDRERLTLAWEVVMPLAPIITKGAQAKKAWSSRYLGSNVDDLPSMVIEQMVLVLAKSDKDLDLLGRAARGLGEQMRSSGKMPGEQLDDAERKERREMAKARKWLMGLVNNRIMGALVDSYTSQRNLRWDNIDLIATVMASISGPTDDAYINRHKADRAPAFLGTKFPAPGKVDGNLLSTAIAGAITARGLDPLVELLLDGDRVRTDGAFSWSENARDVFLLSPQGGQGVWDLVTQATEHLANPRRARGDAARTHIRNLFEWMPGLIVEVVESFDFHRVAHYTICKRTTALLASPFEQRVTGERGYAEPALSFATPQDAARAIAEHIAILTNGEELVSSVVFS